MKTIKTCTSEVQANIIKEKLQNEGIIVLLMSDNLRPFAQIYKSDSGASTIHVSVPEENYYDAMAILEDDSEFGLRCPLCGSDNLTYSFKESMAKSILNEIMTAITMGPSSSIRYDYICKECGNVIENSQNYSDSEI